MKHSGYCASRTLLCQLWYPGAGACFQAPHHQRLNHRSGERDSLQSLELQLRHQQSYTASQRRKLLGFHKSKPFPGISLKNCLGETKVVCTVKKTSTQNANETNYNKRYCCSPVCSSSAKAEIFYFTVLHKHRGYVGGFLKTVCEEERPHRDRLLF